MFMFCSMIECMNNEQSLLIYFPPELLRKNLQGLPRPCLSKVLNGKSIQKP